MESATLAGSSALYALAGLAVIAFVVLLALAIAAADEPVYGLSLEQWLGFSLVAAVFASLCVQLVTSYNNVLRTRLVARMLK